MEEPEQELHSDQMYLEQNKALVREMRRYKKDISDSKSQLEKMKLRAQEMESTVSLIQRTWSQLQQDINSILDELGDPETQIRDVEEINLLDLYLNAGKYNNKADDDDKSTSTKNKTQNLEDEEEGLPSESNNVSSNEVKMETEENLGSDDGADGESRLQDHLYAQAHFTLSLLDRLCFVVGEVGTFSQMPEVIQANMKSDDFTAKCVSDLQRISELSKEIVNVNAEIYQCQQRKRQVDKHLERLNIAIETIRSKLPSNSKAFTTNSEAPTQEESTNQDNKNDSAPTEPNSNQNSVNIESELQKTVENLEKQLIESESIKSNAELALNEMIARPQQQSENQISDLKKSMDDFRLQSKQKILSLVEENCSLQDKVASLDTLLLQMETVYKEKLEEIINTSKSELLAKKAEIEKIKTNNSTLESRLVLLPHLESMAKELNEIETLRKSQVETLTKCHKSLAMENDWLNQRIVQSTRRIDRLKQVETVDMDILHKHSLERVKDMETWLTRLDNTMVARNQDMLLLDAHEKSFRAAQERATKALADTETAKRMRLEDGDSLGKELGDYKRRTLEVDTRISSCDSQIKRQSQTMSQLLQSEHSLRSELSRLRRSLLEDCVKVSEAEQYQTEAKQKVLVAERELDLVKERSSLMQARCSEIAKKLENERKIKTDAQNKSKRRRDRSSEELAASGNEEAEMLAMTMSMLRCSVCKDRYKNVCISRCMHLFCRPCIEDCLKNRQRKCPVCGEKFGPDDVKTVYFTH